MTTLRPRLRFSLRTLFVAVATFLTLLFTAGELLKTYVRASVGHGVRAEFTSLPPDEQELEKWLASQPGVIKVVSARDANAVRVYWIMSRNLRGDPPSPDLRKEFERLGYRGISNFNGNWMDN